MLKHLMVGPWIVCMGEFLFSSYKYKLAVPLTFDISFGIQWRHICLTLWDVSSGVLLTLTLPSSHTASPYLSPDLQVPPMLQPASPCQNSMCHKEGMKNMSLQESQELQILVLALLPFSHLYIFGY